MSPYSLSAMTTFFLISLVKAIHFQAETFLTERQHFRVWVATPAQLLLEVVSVDRHALLPLVLANPEQNVSNLGNASLPKKMSIS